MNRVVLAFSIFTLPLFAQDEGKEGAGLFGDEAPPLMEVLAGLQPGKTPAAPVAWTSPHGAIVLHGDLFRDGRHLAVVGTNATSFAVGDKNGWRLLARFEVEPAWVPAGKQSKDLGYFHIHPSEQPFVLKDLDGDGVPEILIAFDSYGYHLGSLITKKKGEGIELLPVRAEGGEPQIKAGYMTLISAHSGSKSWGWVSSFYRWSDGVPVKVGLFGEDSFIADNVKRLAVRHLPDGSNRAYGIRQTGGMWIVESGTWDGGYRLSQPKDFAKVRFTAGGAEAESFGEVLLFERLTGLPGEVLVDVIDLERLRTVRSTMKMEIEGSAEAIELIGKGAPRFK